MSKHTPWFNEPPVRDGVFQRRRVKYDHLGNKPAALIISYAKFAKGCWFCEGKTPAQAQLRDTPSFFQYLEWRGLAVQP